MTYITKPTGHLATFSSRIATMILAGCALLVLQPSAVQAQTQWTTNGNNINNTNSGNVGVGTTNPSEKLEVNGTVKSGGLTITGAPSEPANVNALYLGMSGTTATIDAVNQNVDFRDLVISSKTFNVKSWNGGSLVTGLFQNNAGNVGLGTTNPQSNLQMGIQTGSSTSSPVRLSLGGTFSNTAGTNFKLRLYDDGTPSNIYGIGVSAGSMDFGVSSAGGYNWYTGGAHKMTLTSGGSVGIGTTSPGTPLTVAADANALSYRAWRNVNTNGWGIIGLRMALNNSSGAVTDYAGINGAIVSNTAGAEDGVMTFWTIKAGTITEQARLDKNGNLGIGLTSPTEKLDVVGNIKVSGSGAGNITASGTITGGTINAKYQDVAEWVETSQALPAGTVVVLDHTRSNQVVASSKSYDTRVAGVISAQPGITLGEQTESKVLVATTGRVKVKVDASAGPIQVGDLLVTSDVTGVAKKSAPLNLGGVEIHRPGTLIGKALEPLAGGTGEILVLLSLQ